MPNHKLPMATKIPAAEIVVSLQGITNSFGANIVHKDLNLDIFSGEILGLIGGSGSGKSVLLRTILGLNKQKAGKVIVTGLDMGSATEKEKNAVRQRWGVLFQDGALFSSLNVGENIQFPLREFTNLSAKEREKIALQKLDAVGLPTSAYDKLPSELSGGMRKRAGLARALSMDPALLLLDEPTAGLDPIGASDFDSLLLTLRRHMNLTVLMVTHDLDSLYANCDRIAVLAEKYIYASGTINELLQVQHPWIQAYFTGPRGRAAAISAKARATN